MEWEYAEGIPRRAQQALIGAPGWNAILILPGRAC
jgi:hypothetical protein